MILRDYQVAAVQSIPAFYAKYPGEDRHALICMPTGTGKSLVIGALTQLIMSFAGQRVMMLTHVQELIEQNHGKLMALWPQAPAGIYSSGLKRKDKYAPVTFAGIQSVVKKAAIFGRIDVLLIDECHLVSPKDNTSYRKFINELKIKNPLLKVIGLTATPWRMGHGKITEGEDRLFTDVAIDMTTREAFNWFISEGYLVPVYPLRTKYILDVSGVKTQGGEYKQQELQLAVDRDEITERAIDETLQHAADRSHWLVFCAGVEHAIHTAAIMNAKGIKTIAIHSDMGKDARRDAIAAWKSGEYTAATNNNILTTGIDFPGIDLIVMLRPSKSVILWVQMNGRGTRPVYADGFDLWTREGRLEAIAAGPKADGCLVLDFANNTKNLGPINDPKIPRKPGEGGGEAPSKCCPVCNTWNHPTARNCFKCDAEFTFNVKIQAKADDRELIKSDNPITEEFAVDQITYMKHAGRGGKPPSLLVNYYCGLKNFKQWVPIEAFGSARNLAKRWWNERSRSIPLPNSVDEAMAVVSHLPSATHIRVWTNKQYPEVLASCYDGTNFGKQAPNMKPIAVFASAPPAAANVPWKKDDGRSIEQQEVDRLNENMLLVQQQDRQRNMGFDIRDDDVGF